jgi:CRISPR-associated protein Cas2
MIVITLTDCPVSLRGDLTKWLLEISAGVFVGQVNKRIREHLWERVTKFAGSGRATMVYSTNNEQHLDFKIHGNVWEPIDFDGIKLVLRPSPERMKRLSALRSGYSKASKWRMAKQMRTKSTEKTRNPKHFPQTYVVVDIETSGLSPKNDEIIELGALLVENDAIVDSFDRLICPTRPINDKIEKLTGITNAMLREKGGDLVTCMRDFRAFMGDNIVVGHNVCFDLNFINHCCGALSLPTAENEYCDTLDLARHLIRDTDSYTLTSVAAHLGIDSVPEHRGLSDCHVTKAVYDQLMARMKGRDG